MKPWLVLFFLSASALAAAAPQRLGASLPVAAAMKAAYGNYRGNSSSVALPKKIRPDLLDAERGAAQVAFFSVYREGATEKAILVSAVRPESEENSFDCAMCAPYLGLYTFTKEKGLWQLATRDPWWRQSGSNGIAPSFSLVKTGPQKFALLAEQSSLSGGEMNSSAELILLGKSGAQSALNIPLGTDSSGACEGAKPCQEHFESGYRFLPAGKGEHFAVELELEGIVSEGKDAEKLVPVHRRELYELRGDRYLKTKEESLPLSPTLTRNGTSSEAVYRQMLASDEARQGFAVADRDLNAAYRALVKQKKGLAVQELKQRQRAWIKRKEELCQKLERPGDRWAFEASVCREKETKSRLAELRHEMQ